MLLVGALDAAQDLYGFIRRRFIDIYRLETTFQGGIAFDILAILFQGGRADGLQFAARQGRFQNVGRVHRAAGRTGANQHMNFIDEENRVAGFQLFNHALQTLFKLAAVHGAGNEAADIELQDALAVQRVRHLAFDDALGQILR